MKPATSRAAALAIAASTIPLLLLATASSYANTYHPPHSPLDTQASLEIHVAALEAQLMELGSELPPQDLRLIEPQQDYARALQQLGRHEQAIAAFGAALQIHRSHHGLFDIDQLALVDRLLESHMALGQWEAVDDLQHFRYQIARHALPAGADTRIDALMQLTVWKLRASEHGLLEHSLRDANEVADLHRRELDLVEHAGKPDQVARHHLGIADLALLQARAKVATRTAVGLGSGLPLAPLGLHGQLQETTGTDRPPQLVERLEPFAFESGAALDIFDIGRHLQEYKQSISKAHSLVNAADLPASEQHRSVSESIRRSLEAYNGFLLQVVLRRF